MRIIAGQYKGRRLKTPTWEGLRPTSDKLRETMFNILAPRVAGARVLDGFAGTGAVGIEALSRGAAHVTFVEQNVRATSLITANLTACGAAPVYTIERGDFTVVVGRFGRDRQFDLILLDPPYALDAARLREALATAAAHLAGDGVLVLERATRVEPDVPDTLERLRDVKSGDSTLTLFRGKQGRGGPTERA